MPTYEYRCKDCEHRFDVVRAFTDDALTTCPECGGTLRKVFGNVGITFKGSGFYKTDSRRGGPSTASGDGDKADKADKGSDSKSDSKSDGKGDSKGDSKGDTAKKPDAKTSDGGSGSGSGASKAATKAS